MVPGTAVDQPKLTVASAPSAAVTKRRGGCSRARATATSSGRGQQCDHHRVVFADAVDSAYVVIIGKPEHHAGRDHAMRRRCAGEGTGCVLP